MSNRGPYRPVRVASKGVGILQQGWAGRLAGRLGGWGSVLHSLGAPANLHAHLGTYVSACIPVLLQRSR